MWVEAFIVICVCRRREGRHDELRCVGGCLYMCLSRLLSSRKRRLSVACEVCYV